MYHWLSKCTPVVPLPIMIVILSFWSFTLWGKHCFLLQYSHLPGGMGRWRSNKVLYLKTIPVMTFHQTEGILNLANTFIVMLCTQNFYNFSLFGSADPQTDINSFFHLPGLPYLMMSREKKTQDFIKIGDNRLDVHSSWEMSPSEDLCTEYLRAWRKRRYTFEMDEESGIDWINQWETIWSYAHGTWFHCCLRGRII